MSPPAATPRGVQAFFDYGGERTSERSSRVEAAKAVPHRSRGARGQDRQNPLVLIIAVERDPRQRRQMTRAFGKHHARPCRHRSLESGGTRQREFTYAGRDLVAIGISEIQDLPLDPALDPVAPDRHLLRRMLLAL